MINLYNKTIDFKISVKGRVINEVIFLIIRTHLLKQLVTYDE